MNPNFLINSILQNNPAIKNNPIINNALNMAQQGNTNGLKELAQNVSKERGIDLNQTIQNIRNTFGF